MYYNIHSIYYIVCITYNKLHFAVYLMLKTRYR